MHAVFRRYRIRLGAVEAAAERAHDGLVPDLRRVPGFAAYYLVHAGNDTLASIALFQTEESAVAVFEFMMPQAVGDANVGDCAGKHGVVEGKGGEAFGVRHSRVLFPR